MSFRKSGKNKNLTGSLFFGKAQQPKLLEPKAFEPLEIEIQKDFVKWLDLYAPFYPVLKWFFAPPNGAFMPRGEAIKMLLSGLRPGVSDMILLAPRNGFHGLVIEHKTRVGRLSDVQCEFRDFVLSEGFSWHLSRSWHASANITIEYLDLPLEPLKEHTARPFLIKPKI
jgi:hypothetical protein